MLKLRRSLYQLRGVKATTLFEGASNCKCLRLGEHSRVVPNFTKKKQIILGGNNYATLY